MKNQQISTNHTCQNTIEQSRFVKTSKNAWKLPNYLNYAKMSLIITKIANYAKKNYN